MVNTGNAGDSDSKRGGKRRAENSTKYTRFSDQQVEIFEKVYAEYQNPTRLQRVQMLHDYPVLKNLNIRQIKVWFQNRRSREKLRKENIELQAVNQKLTATNKLLTEENDHLQKKVTRLVHENECLHHQLQNVASATELNFESAANSPQLSSSHADNDISLLLLAEETKEEFLLKAIGDAIDWIPTPGIKPGCDSVGIVYVSHNCVGLAARACSVIPLGPIKIMEILKERASWSRDCRKFEVFAKYPARNEGTIELVYTQFYAPTTLASARDFWTLRYTSALEDGSLLVCEKSLSGSSVPINAPASLEFIRAKMLASGYLIRPCEGGGSTIHIVDHLDLEASSVPYVLQPLYESSELVAQKLTVAALGHIELIAKEMSGKLPVHYGMQPASLRSFSHRLSRGFNDAINTFSEDGWILMDYDASEDLVISTKPTKNLGINANYDGVLCVKASMLLQNISPAMLVRRLRDHRSDWADISYDARAAASLDAGSFGFPGFNSKHFYDPNVFLGRTVNEDEILEIMEVESQTFCWRDSFRGNVYLLQICNGMEDKGIGACSELIFAPIDGTLPDNAILLASGFRILSLGSKTHNGQDILTANWAKNLARYTNGQAATSHSASDAASLNNSCSVLITVFQFPFVRNCLEDVATRAQQYVHHVISSVQKVAKAATPAGSKPDRGIQLVPDSNEAVNLANWICQSYRSNLGGELLKSNAPVSDSLLERLWDHQDAILSWSFKERLQSTLFCSFANQAGLMMLETTQAGLQDISLDMIFDEPGKAALSSVVPIVMQQGYAFLYSGICMSTMARYISYEQAVAWRVLNQEGSIHCIAFAFTSWSFV